MIIANFHEMYNYFSKEINKPLGKNILIENYSKILVTLNPFIPHFTSECLDELNKFKNIESDIWPEVNKKYLEEENIHIVIQINGKKREVLKIRKDTLENKVLEIVNNNDKIINYIKDKKIIKKIFVPNKILNLIVK